MSKGLIFFCCSCAILLLTIINLSVGPIVSKTVGTSWGTGNCEYFSDVYDRAKDSNLYSDDHLKYNQEYDLIRCQRRKAMHDMEYTSFIFDIVIGFVCGLLGLLHYLDLKKEFVSKTGLIGLGCGIVGFVLTFVYVVYNGIVYTSYGNNEYKRDSNGAFAEWKGNHYECFYYDEPENYHSKYAKYSDLIQKQYNYDKDLKHEFDSLTSEAHNCKSDSYSTPTYTTDIDDCAKNEYIRQNNQKTYTVGSETKNCKYLYVQNAIDEVENKDLSDRFLATLILSLFVCLANIGLALFGFLLFRTPGEF